MQMKFSARNFPPPPTPDQVGGGLPPRRFAGAGEKMPPSLKRSVDKWARF